MGRLRDLGQRIVHRLRDPAPAEPRPAPAPPRPLPRPAPPGPPPPTALAAAQAQRYPDEVRPADLDALRRALGPAPRVRVVNHWATWCEPCVEELPLLVAVHLQLEDAADFLGISWERFSDDRDPPMIAEIIADFASTRAVRYPSLLVMDPPERFFAALAMKNQQIPQTWVVDKYGAVVHEIHGALDETSAAALVKLVEGMQER